MSTIPKIIHQTWKNNDLPFRLKRYSNSWKKHHPDWQYILWTDGDNDNLVKEYYPEYLELYKNLPYIICKVDMVRLLYLHKYGGIYCDTDYQCFKSFDDVINDKNYKISIVESPYKYNENLQNSLMISEPGQQFWLDCIDEISRFYNEKMKGKTFKKSVELILEIAGPRMIDRIHKTKNYKNEVKVLTVKPFFKGPRSIHHQEGTWTARTMQDMEVYPFNSAGVLTLVAFLLLI